VPVGDRDLVHRAHAFDFHDELNHVRSAEPALTLAALEFLGVNEPMVEDRPVHDFIHALPRASISAMV
jgi:hypothetical protein